MQYTIDQIPEKPNVRNYISIQSTFISFEPKNAKIGDYVLMVSLIDPLSHEVYKFNITLIIKRKEPNFAPFFGESLQMVVIE